MEKINFLHVNASDTRWGASLSGYRFHKALCKQGYGSQILCAVKETKDNTVSTIVPGRFGYIASEPRGWRWKLRQFRKGGGSPCDTSCRGPSRGPGLADHFLPSTRAGQADREAA